MSAKLTPWPNPEPPTRAELERIFDEERLSPNWWSSGPGEQYASHSHQYHKVLFCAKGSIAFRLDATGENITLAPGDRLDIPPGTIHSANVGPSGVTCVEAPQRSD